MKTFVFLFKRPFHVLTLLMAFGLGYNLKAQTTLIPGDIAFTGYNCNNANALQNDFSFVILRAGGISANTTINFTDNGYKVAAVNALNTIEGTLVWTSTTAMAQFTQVYIRVNASGSSIDALSAGSIAGGFSSFILSQAGDQVLAYQGSSASPTFISGIHMNSDPGVSTTAGWDNIPSGTSFTQNRSDVPPGLTSGVNCVAPDPSIGSSEKDNGIYNCTGATGASLAAIRTAINTAANWDIRDATFYPLPPSCTFGVASPLSATATSTNVSCNGLSNGRASVAASGGAGGYTYSWAPSGGTASLATGLSAGIYTITVTDAVSASTTATVMITQPSALVATTSATNTSCFGLNNGRASVSVSGGTPSYFYSWAPSGGTASLATGLAANNYTCTVTDNNSCIITVTVTVTQPSALVATTSATNVSCNGGNNGMASVSVGGGTPSYFYSWAPSGGTSSTATGLSAGNYTVTTTDNNSCTRTTTIAVTQPASINTTTSVVNASCYGYSNGIVAVSVSGGTSPYTYTWSPTGGNSPIATGRPAGSYTVNGRDNNGCTFSRICNVTEPPVLVAGTSFTNTSCNGGADGAAGVSVSGGTPGYTYTWAPSGGNNAIATGLSTGTYTCTIEDVRSCQLTKTVTIGEPAAISIATAVAGVSCHGGSNGTATVTASGGSGGYSYSWAPSGGAGSTATGLSAGNYTVTVTDAGSCVKTAFVTVTEPTAITTSTAAASVSCNGGSSGTATVTASGGSGGYMYSWAPSGGNGSTATGLSAGNYTVTVTDGGSCVETAFVTVTEPTAITASTAVLGASCHGDANGKAMVTASGGSGGYSYSWAPAGGTGTMATGLSAGNYTVTVTDANNCTHAAFATISEPTVLLATTTHTNATCGVNNGIASVSVSGGAGAYTYSWTPVGGSAATATGLGAGNYTITVVDANACVIAQTIALTSSGSISGVITTTAVSCNGGNNGAASVAATGGAGAYTYTWMPGNTNTATVSGLTSGTYTVQVRDAASCLISFTASISQPPSLTGSVTYTNIACNGASNGIANVSVSGGTGSYSYTWSPSGGNAATASGLAPGSYTVSVKDANNCMLSHSVLITEPSALNATISGTNISCGGGSNGAALVTASGGTGAYTYTWSPSGGNTSSASGLTANTYTVTIKDANLCTITRTISLTEPASMTAVTSQTNLSCNASGNGAAGITVSGGAGSYIYSWTPSGGTLATASGLTANSYTVEVKDANNCSISRTYTITQPAALATVVSHTNIGCNGAANGIATASVSGGTGAYSYTWSPSGGNAAIATGLNVGTYTIAVTDINLCTSSATVSISQPTALSAAISVTNIACHGTANGSASATVSGGTGAYTYTWSPSGGNTSSATGLTAGNYSVMISDVSNCMITYSLSVTEPTALVATASHTDISCFGLTNGSASVSATGGSGAYTYTWMPGGSNALSISSLVAGVYTVSVKDASGCQANVTASVIEPAAVTYTQNLSICQGQSVTVGSSTYTAAGTYTNVLTSVGGCDSTITTILMVNAPPTLTLSASSPSVCAGTSATLTATGATTYTWSNGIVNGAGFIPAATQIYTVTGANGGCGVTATISIQVNPKPVVVANTTSTLICAGNSVTLSGSGANTYSWTGGVTNGTAFNPTITATYTLTGTNASACTNTAVVTVSVNPCTGIGSYSSETVVSVTPNPVNSTAVVYISHFDQLSSAKVSLELYDNTGRIVKQVAVTGSETTLSREGLADGLYYYHITTNGTATLKGKLIVQ